MKFKEVFDELGKMSLKKGLFIATISNVFAFIIVTTFVAIFHLTGVAYYIFAITFQLLFSYTIMTKIVEAFGSVKKLRRKGLIA